MVHLPAILPPCSRACSALHAALWQAVYSHALCMLCTQLVLIHALFVTALNCTSLLCSSRHATALPHECCISVLCSSLHCSPMQRASKTAEMMHVHALYTCCMFVHCLSLLFPALQPVAASQQDCGDYLGHKALAYGAFARPERDRPLCIPGRLTAWRPLVTEAHRLMLPLLITYRLTGWTRLPLPTTPFPHPLPPPLPFPTLPTLPPAHLAGPIQRGGQGSFRRCLPYVAAAGSGV